MNLTQREGERDVLAVDITQRSAYAYRFGDRLVSPYPIVVRQEAGSTPYEIRDASDRLPCPNADMPESALARRARLPCPCSYGECNATLQLIC